MPQFSPKSIEKLQTCDKRLQEICYAVILQFDFTVLCGERDEIAQEAAFNSGASTKHFGDSKHNSNPSKAVDIAPYPIDDKDIKRFYYLAGMMKATAYNRGYRIRWGGDWNNNNNFNDEKGLIDLFHFEIID